MDETKKELKRAQRKYQKVCDKLEQLNEEAFELEKEIMYLNSKIKTK